MCVRIAHRPLVVCAALLALIAISQVARGSDKPTSPTDAQAAIEKNLQTPEGKAFDERMGKEFLDKHVAPLHQCKASGNAPADFWLLVRLDKSGTVQEVLLHPSTKFGECVRDFYRKDKFLPPPRPDYWVGIYLKLVH